MVEIVDRESAENWLRGQNHQTEIWFASRCALRALPVLCFEPAQTFDRLALAWFRATSIASIASSLSEKTVKKLISRADKAAESAGIATRNCGDAAYHAIAAARSAAYTVVDSSIHSAGAAAAYSAGAAPRSEAYSACNEDVAQSLRWPALWPESAMPTSLADHWSKLKNRFNAAPEKWGFWCEWYEAILNGTPLPWELSFRIATELSEEDWESGPAHVAARITDIRIAFDLAEAAKHASKNISATSTENTSFGRGHNNPPELINDPKLTEGFQQVRPALDKLANEARSKTPDKEAAAAALLTIQKWLSDACRYVGRKLDLAIDTAIKWSIPAVGGYFWLNPEKLQLVIELGKRWLGM